MKCFGKDFLWGAATSAHQVEGGNISSDWWEFEVAGKLKYHSAQACGHYKLYEQDFDLAKSLNHNCHRLSIEWARIEPSEGEFCLEELAHYQKVIRSLRSRGIEPIVTLHHFTNPAWFAKKGGWAHSGSAEYFLRYVSFLLNGLAEQVQYWVTINEPMVYIYHSFFLGLWPPQEKSLFKTESVRLNLLKAHIKAYRIITAFYRKKNLGKPLVSIAQNMQAFEPCTPSLKNRLAVYLRVRSFNLDFIERCIRARALDFIGVNYYSRSLVELKGWSWKNFAMDVCDGRHSNLKKNSLGWEIYPEGFYKVLICLKKYKLPVFILENGVCTEDDSLRWDFIRSHLQELARAMDAGIKVMGYIYWSLIDNFEWDKGFAPRFGLIEVEYPSLRRTIRDSAKKFASVILEGGIK